MEITKSLLADTCIALVSESESECERVTMRYAEVAETKLGGIAKEVATRAVDRFGSWKNMLTFSARRIYGDENVLLAMSELVRVIEEARGTNTVH